MKYELFTGTCPVIFIDVLETGQMGMLQLEHDLEVIAEKHLTEPYQRERAIVLFRGHKQMFEPNETGTAVKIGQDYCLIGMLVDFRNNALPIHQTALFEFVDRCHVSTSSTRPDYVEIKGDTEPPEETKQVQGGIKL